MLDVAVVVCTFNPDERLLSRTLAAIEAQNTRPSLRIECVIVDNRSDPPVTSLGTVRSFLERCPWARVIVQTTPGLSHARAAGIAATRASLVCFVDDDNEPAPGYVAAASDILTQRECIGVIGPGKVSVDFVDPTPDWFARRYSHHFQEKDADGLTYGCVAGTWTDYYPPGSCMVVRRAPLERYRAKFLAGELWASDRVGASLSSGGDTQIVWEVVKMGLAAGISGDLRIVHMIPAKRANLAYMKRLAFGTSSSYLPALVSSFPELRASLPTPRSEAQIAWTALKMTVRSLLHLRLKVLPVDLATVLGGFLGATRAAGVRSPRIERLAKALCSF